jgi:cob(I)alamin adenosyltransferase
MNDEESQHRESMQALQAEMRAKMRAAKDKRGLIMVNTGHGKGKSTAGFGVVTRMLAHGGKVVVIQFIKATPDHAERVLRGPDLTWHAVGGGFTWDTQDKAADIALCEKGWALAKEAMADLEVDLIMLDELNVVMHLGYLPVTDIVATFAAKREDLHIVVTGRDAPAELMELADLVSEMREVKHPFNHGVMAQRGIEF